MVANSASTLQTGNTEGDDKTDSFLEATRSMTKETRATRTMANRTGLKSSAIDMRTTYGETVEHHQLTNKQTKRRQRAGKLLSPEARWRKRWDVFQAIILLYLAVVVPLRVGFDQPTEGAPYVLDLFIDLYFWVDIGFNFVFAYENDEGVIVYDFWKISRHYLKGWFLLDLVASLPIDMVMRMANGEFLCSISKTCSNITETDARMIRLVKLIRVLRLMKMLRLVRVQRLLDRYQDELFILMSYIKILKLVLILIFLGHIFGCFFYFFSTADWRTTRENERLGADGSWIEQNQISKIDMASLAEMYSVASYWAFTTMTTVGYGDISAGTQAERIWAIIGMLAGGFIFSGLIGQMSKLINTRDLSRQAYQDKMDLVGAFVRDSRLPSELRLRVLRFFRRQEVHAYDEHELLCELPFKERMDMLWFSYGALIMSVPVFRSANRMFLGEVMNYLEPMNLQPGTMILFKGQAASHMYLIAKGLVELLCDDGETVYRILHMGAYFGEESIFASDGDGMRHSDLDDRLAGDEALHTESVRVSAEGNVKLLRVARQDMEAALDRHPDVLEMMRKEHIKKTQMFFEGKAKRTKEITGREYDPTASGDGTQNKLIAGVCDQSMKNSYYYRQALEEATSRIGISAPVRMGTQMNLANMMAGAQSDSKRDLSSKATSPKTNGNNNSNGNSNGNDSTDQLKDSRRVVPENVDPADLDPKYTIGLSLSERRKSATKAADAVAAANTGDHGSSSFVSLSTMATAFANPAGSTRGKIRLPSMQGVRSPAHSSPTSRAHGGLMSLTEQSMKDMVSKITEAMSARMQEVVQQQVQLQIQQQLKDQPFTKQIPAKVDGPAKDQLDYLDRRLTDMERSINDRLDTIVLTMESAGFGSGEELEL